MVGIRAVISVFLVLWLQVIISVQSSTPEVLYEWTQLDYDWPRAAMREEWIANEKFIPANNALAGIKVFGDEIFVTVPRWREGVPATLCTIIRKDGKPILKPWPTWEMNDEFEVTALQYVQSMEIDPQGRMWIIDTARRNFMSNKGPSAAIPAAPKLFIIDIITKQILRVFVFPPEIAHYDTAFLNDIVLDIPRGFAYISDTSEKGGIIIYDFNTNTARRFDAGPGMQPEVKKMKIDGKSYDISIPVDGIALSVDTETLYFCPLSGTTLSSIETKFLRDFTLSNKQLSNEVKKIGTKQSYSDGLAIDENGIMYFGVLEDHTIAKWNTKTDISTQTQVVPPDGARLQWPDTFAFDNKGALFFTTNKLHHFFANELDYNGNQANFRVVKVSVGAKSYLAAQPSARLGHRDF